MARFLGFCVLMLVAAGCADTSGGLGAQQQDDFEIYEAVFRYRLRHQPANTQVYLAIDGKDVPADVLKRLKTTWPNLKQMSEQPKEKGYLVYANDLKRSGSDRAEVKAGYWFPTKFAGEGYFGKHHLVRRDGQWTVENVTDEANS